jgi:uncharacterized MAPEG superfamily protein
MSTDLKYLALTAMLTASLWIPYVIAQVMNNGPLTLLIQMTGKANGTTALLAASFFWLRLVHAIVYWAAIPYIRTIVFTLGYVVVIGLFVELMM